MAVIGTAPEGSGEQMLEECRMTPPPEALIHWPAREGGELIGPSLSPFINLNLSPDPWEPLLAPLQQQDFLGSQVQDK